MYIHKYRYYVCVNEGNGACVLSTFRCFGVCKVLYYHLTENMHLHAFCILSEISKVVATLQDESCLVFLLYRWPGKRTITAHTHTACTHATCAHTKHCVRAHALARAQLLSLTLSLSPSARAHALRALSQVLHGNTETLHATDAGREQLLSAPKKLC